MNRLLTSDLWKEAAKLSRKAKQRQAAIAYVTSETVKFGKGDVLIIDASPLAIQSGQTSATMLQAAFERGAEVYSCARLHAKLLVLDDSAIIGSANLSRSSAEVLEECAVLTQDRKLVGQARAYLQRLREESELLTAKRLKQLVAMPVVRSTGPRLPKRKAPELGNRCWFVGVSPLKKELSDSEEAARSKAERQASKRRPDTVEHLKYIRLIGASQMRKELKPGDRFITFWGNHGKTNHLRIDAPLTVLSRAEDENAVFFYFDQSEVEEFCELGKREFMDLMLERADLAFEPTPRQAREVKDPKVFEALDKWWPRL